MNQKELRRNGKPAGLIATLLLACEHVSAQYTLIPRGPSPENRITGPAGSILSAPLFCQWGRGLKARRFIIANIETRISYCNFHHLRNRILSSEKREFIRKYFPRYQIGDATTRAKLTNLPLMLWTGNFVVFYALLTMPICEKDMIDTYQARGCPLFFAKVPIPAFHSQRHVLCVLAALLNSSGRPNCSVSLRDRTAFQSVDMYTPGNSGRNNM